MNTTPPGLRTARIVAADAREGDQLHHADGWWTITAVSPHGLMVELKCAELLDVVRYHRATPILVRWPVPATTVGLAHDVRR